MEKIQPSMPKTIQINFWSYFISMAVTFVGFYGFTYIVTWLMINETKTPQLLGNVMAITMVPAIVLNLVAQRLLTKINARLMMMITDLLTGLLLVGVYFLMAVPRWQITVLIVASVLNKTIGVFYKLSNKTILPALFPVAKIQQVNGTQTQVRQVAIVSSSMIISTLLLWIQPRLVILLIGGGFLVSVFFDAQLTLLVPNPRQPRGEEPHDWRQVLKQTGMGPYLGYAVLGSLVDASLAVLIPWLAVTLFHQSIALSILMTAEAAGIICGPLWLKRFSTVKLRTLCLLTLLGLVFFVPNFWVLTVGMVAVGSLRGAFNVLFFSKVQTDTAPQNLGWIMAIVLTVTDTATVVGTLVVPRLTQFWHQWTISMVGLGLLILLGTRSLLARINHWR